MTEAAEAILDRLLDVARDEHEQIEAVPFVDACIAAACWAISAIEHPGEREHVIRTYSDASEWRDAIERVRRHRQIHGNGKH